ncbi:hypothetical protein [Pseudomonas fulva]|uniref:hypothetical protein n=1 Tax=Pseudomonas fulva TaxID=47880 RepID=UPI003CF036D2
MADYFSILSFLRVLRSEFLIKPGQTLGFSLSGGAMSWDVLVAAIKQKEALQPDDKVARVTISEDFLERIKLDKNAVIGSSAISPTEVELHLLGYPLSIKDMQPDFLISMSPR